MKVTPQETAIRLAWPFDLKLEYACKKLSEYIIHFKGEVYLSFSAGKDSQVVAEIINRIWDGTFKHITPNWERLVKYPKPVFLFSNTGLEFPQIVEHAKSFNAEIIKPKMGFTRVIKEVGVAVGSKKIAEMIRRTRGYIKNPSPANEATLKLYTTGIKKDGTKGATTSKLAKRWLNAAYNAPFDISEKCCDILKKEPFERYAEETGKKPITGTRIEGEGDRRKTSYYLTGCNTFDEGKERCRPISIFTDADIWEFAGRFKIRFASVYYDRVEDVEQLDGSLKKEFLPAETRTGCTFCMFGLHLEEKDKPNRIQRLAISHPKYYDIIINKCGLGDILKWLDLPYEPFKIQIAEDLEKRLVCGSRKLD